MSHENTPSQYWTYRMEVSPTGQAHPHVAANANDPIALLQLLINLNSNILEQQRQMLETQRQQLELTRETVQFAREQRARQIAELEKWQTSHDGLLDECKDSLSKLEQVHANLMRDLTEYVAENHDDLLDGEYSLTDFVDRFGPRLAHLNTMLAVLRPLSVVLTKKTEG